MSRSPKLQVMFASAFSCFGDFFRIFVIHIFKVTASLRFHEMKLRASPAVGQRALASGSRAARERLAWSLAIGRRGVIAILGCHCRKASHNASNARRVTAGKMGRNSSQFNAA